MRRAYKYTLKPIFEEQDPCSRYCEHEGCQEKADFRAPKDRKLQDYFWFCLDHVRIYNAKWDFYKGMSSIEIERHQHADLTWQRPSWSIHSSLEGEVRREFYVFEGCGRGVQSTEDERMPFAPTSIEAKALAFFNLGYPFQAVELKMTYKKLVKMHHPDFHGGSPESQEILKQINEYFEALEKMTR